MSALLRVQVPSRARIDALADQVSVLLQYDQAGNLLHQHESEQAHGAGTLLQQVSIDGVTRTVSRDLASNPGKTQDLWYAYDAMNRQVMIEGAANGNVNDVNNLTEAQGHAVTYDKNGNITSDTYQGSQLVAQVGADGKTSYVVHQGRITVYYRYDAAGRLYETAVGAVDAAGNALDESQATVVSQNDYDAAGRLIQTGRGDKVPAGYIQAAANHQADAFSTDRTVRSYDADGRLQSERITDPSGALVQETSYAGGYDAVGNVLSYTITEASGNVSVTRVSDIKEEGYLRSSIVTTKTAPSGVAVSTSSRYSYDVNGQLVRTDTTSAMGEVSTLKQVNDVAGNILQTDDGSAAWDRLVVGSHIYAVWDPPAGGGSDPSATITGYYEELLGREPDADGLTYWVNAVVNWGHSLDDVYNSIINSAEYKQLHSNDGSGGTDGTGSGSTAPPPPPPPTPADLVTQAYQSLLGRTPAASEVSYWTDQMAHGLSIVDVEARMQASPEYENRKDTIPDQGNFDVNGNPVFTYQPGDTLQGLAQAAYGDPSLASVIAQANGISSDADLSTLKTVIIPKSGAVASQNTAPQTDKNRRTGSSGLGAPPGGNNFSLAGTVVDDFHNDVGINAITSTRDSSDPLPAVIDTGPVYSILADGGGEKGSAGALLSPDDLGPLNIDTTPFLDLPDINGSSSAGDTTGTIGLGTGAGTSGGTSTGGNSSYPEGSGYTDGPTAVGVTGGAGGTTGTNSSPGSNPGTNSQTGSPNGSTTDKSNEYQTYNGQIVDADGNSVPVYQLHHTLNGNGAAPGTASLPFLDTSGYVGPGPASTSYGMAVGMMNDSALPLSQRLVAGALATGVAPLAFLDTVGQGILNVPYDASVAGQLLARSTLQTDPAVATVDQLNAVVHLTTAFGNALGVGAMAEGPITRFVESFTSGEPSVLNNGAGVNGSGNISVVFNEGIADHLTKFDGFSQKTGISGTHNLNEFMQAAEQNNVKILSQTPGSSNGIFKIVYKIPAIDTAGNVVIDEAGATVYKSQSFYKSVYDPSVISDQAIVDLGKQAAISGYEQAISSGAQAYNAEAGGIQFRIYIDPKTGNITNYHPT